MIFFFFLDKTYANIAAVDRLLNKADFDEDFIPTCPTLLNNHPTIFTNIDPAIKVIIVVIILWLIILFLHLNILN